MGKLATARFRVLFVEEDIYFLHPYIDHFRDVGVRTKHFTGPEGVIDYLNVHSVDLVVLDVMMPHGLEFNVIETQGGFLTGQALAREIWGAKPDLKIIAFSNHTDAHVEEWFSNQPNSWFISKKDPMSVEEFSQFALAVITDQVETGSEIAEKFLDALELKPGAFGVSVDLKALWKIAARAIKRPRQ